MSADSDGRSGQDLGSTEQDTDIARAMRLVARRAVPAERRALAYQRVHAQWRAALGEARAPVPPLAVRRQWRSHWRGALAASVLVALLAVGIVIPSLGEPPPRFAIAQTVAGSRAVLRRGGPLGQWLSRERALTSGAIVQVGDSLSTDERSAALFRLDTAATLRIAPDSQARIDAPDRVTLLRGRLYVDSGGTSQRAGKPLVIATIHGDVRHVGTRYLVQVTPATLDVAVRAGRARVSPAARALSAVPLDIEAGELLRIVPASGSLERRNVAPDGPEWAWLAGIPAPIEIEGATLRDFLAWYSAETGHEVVLGATPDSEHLGATELHGSVAGLQPDDALQAVAAIADLTVRRAGQRVIVEAAVY